MAGNSFGVLFKITTCGESHGDAIAVIIDGCPAGLLLSPEDIQSALDRRKPGQNTLTTPRQEKDTVAILSGVFEGKTTGAPILLMTRNTDTRPQDYDALKNLYRPSHADFTYQMKYGMRDFRGGGRASARETLARVAAGAVAQKYLNDFLNITFLSYVEQIGSIQASMKASDTHRLTQADIDASPVRCPDPHASYAMVQLIENIKAEKDSLGGIIKGMIYGLPAGLGEPVFDKLHAELGKAFLSINAVKGFEIGSGFQGALMKGSEHNDAFIKDTQGNIKTQTNHAGGVLGGISTGETIYFRVAFKPVATIGKMQKTLTRDHQPTEFKAEGRHDPCVLPRAVPIVDAMGALVIMDHYLRHKAYS